MRITLTILMLPFLIQLNAQNVEVEAIKIQVRKFSQNLMEGKNDEVVNMYTSDGKIFPNDKDILEGEELSNYWNPKNPGEWKTIYHKVTPIEIKVMGNEAYDYGYYEGTSSNGKESSNWKGKYVIVWRKEKGDWKIYLDIWNRIKLEG